MGSGSRSAIHDGLELLGELGSGQFGSVFLVREPGTGTLNALKVISKEAVHEPKQVEHLQSEARIQAELQSDFCVRLVDKAQDSCALYLLQEFVPGGELFYILDVAGALKETDVRFYAGNVLLGLEYMHSKGIVYRDLKPENLLIGPDGYIKLADFGFAKKTPGRRTFTLCGTPDYQAPEVITRKGTGPAADYWALGVLIYELLSGDAPFKGGTEDPWDTFRRILSGRFFIPPFMSTTAADLIYKLLQVNPDTRLGSGPAGALEVSAAAGTGGQGWARGGCHVDGLLCGGGEAGRGLNDRELRASDLRADQTPPLLRRRQLESSGTAQSQAALCARPRVHQQPHRAQGSALRAVQSLVASQAERGREVPSGNAGDGWMVAPGRREEQGLTGLASHPSCLGPSSCREHFSASGNEILIALLRLSPDPFIVINDSWCFSSAWRRFVICTIGAFSQVTRLLMCGISLIRPRVSRCFLLLLLPEWPVLHVTSFASRLSPSSSSHTSGD